MFLTEKQLQHRLEVTLPTLSRWRKEDPPIPFILHTLPNHKKRQSVLYPISEVRTWLLRCRPLLASKLMENICGCKYCEKGGINILPIDLPVSPAPDTANNTAAIG